MNMPDDATTEEINKPYEEGPEIPPEVIHPPEHDA